MQNSNLIFSSIPGFAFLCELKRRHNIIVFPLESYPVYMNSVEFIFFWFVNLCLFLLLACITENLLCWQFCWFLH